VAVGVDVFVGTGAGVEVSVGVDDGRMTAEGVSVGDGVLNAEQPVIIKPIPIAALAEIINLLCRSFIEFMID
jgi:hypothetical protein